jgi:hypothetical protein
MMEGATIMPTIPLGVERDAFRVSPEKSGLPPEEQTFHLGISSLAVAAVGRVRQTVCIIFHERPLIFLGSPLPSGIGVAVEYLVKEVEPMHRWRTQNCAGPNAKIEKSHPGSLRVCGEEQQDSSVEKARHCREARRNVDRRSRFPAVEIFLTFNQ